ncbi:protein of unknown function (plasmid) [Magnetospirillum sp. XM-1]|nr:protein of unknown function [Magnetospirillum sp. XM-1]
MRFGLSAVRGSAEPDQSGVQGLGLVEAVALGNGDAMLAAPGEVGLGLDAFGHDVLDSVLAGDVPGMPEGPSGLLLRGGVIVAEEDAAIELDALDRQGMDAAEILPASFVAFPEACIVQRHADALLGEGSEDGRDAMGIADAVALRDFQFDRPLVRRPLLDEPEHGFGEVLDDQVGLIDVDGDWYRLPPHAELPGDDQGTACHDLGEIEPCPGLPLLHPVDDAHRSDKAGGIGAAQKQLEGVEAGVSDADLGLQVEVEHFEPERPREGLAVPFVEGGESIGHACGPPLSLRRRGVGSRVFDDR